MRKEFDDSYHGARVLVTGHTGFKGSWLCLWLSRLGAEVYGFSESLLPGQNLFELAGIGDLIHHRTGDVRDAAAVRKAVEEASPDFVFHLAAQALVSKAYADPLRTLETNIMGTATVLEAVRLAGRACRIICITSDKCYENREWQRGYCETDRLGGSDPYSASKAGAEAVVSSYFRSYFSQQDSPVRIASTRAGNVVGGGDWAQDRIVPDAMRAWSTGASLTVRAPSSTRPWQHVLEPLGGYLRVGELLENNEVTGEAFNFGPPPEEDHDVETLVRRLADCWGEFGAPYSIAENDALSEQRLLKLNCEKAGSVLDWRAVLDFEECAEFTASWYRDFYGGDSSAVDLCRHQLDSYVEKAVTRKLVWVSE
ncbi:MAG: CDP-glucose 4,6-dehydratase [Verrucomicrobiota bacterium]